MADVGPPLVTGFCATTRGYLAYGETRTRAGVRVGAEDHIEAAGCAGEPLAVPLAQSAPQGVALTWIHGS